MTLPDYIKAKDLSRSLKCGMGFVYGLIREHKITAFRLTPNGPWRIEPASVQRYLESVGAVWKPPRKRVDDRRALAEMVMAGIEPPPLPGDRVCERSCELTA